MVKMISNIQQIFETTTFDSPQIVPIGDIGRQEVLERYVLARAGGSI